jgi:hypothetical protein
VRHATVRPGAAEGPYVALRRVPTRHKLRPPLGVASSPPSGIGRHGCGGLAGTLRVGGRHVARTCRSEAQGMRPEELHGVLRAHNGAGQDPERQAADQPDTALTADDLLGGGSDTGGTEDLLGRVRRGDGSAVDHPCERYMERVQPNLSQVADAAYFRWLLYQHACWAIANEARRLQARLAGQPYLTARGGRSRVGALDAMNSNVGQRAVCTG